MHGYYNYDTVEFDPVINPNIDKGPFLSDTPYGLQSVELLTPEQARKEISEAGSFEHISYRDGGSFDIVIGKIIYEFRVSKDGRTKEGFHTYKPWIKKIFWVR